MNLLVAVLCVVSSLSISVAVILGCRRSWHRENAALLKIREKYIAELTAAKKDMRLEEQKYILTRHEYEYDAAALQLACQELAGVVDIETNEEIFGGNWIDVRNTLRGMVNTHNKAFNEERLRGAYKVKITEG